MVSKEKGGDKMEAIVLMTALINLATVIFASHPLGSADKST